MMHREGQPVWISTPHYSYPLCRNHPPLRTRADPPWCFVAREAYLANKDVTDTLPLLRLWLDG